MGMAALAQTDAYGRENIEASDTLLRAYPSIVEERDCRGFDTQPFGRCRVVFYYDDPEHEGRGCPIYEEFVFNDDGGITWIERGLSGPGCFQWMPRPIPGRKAMA